MAENENDVNNANGPSMYTDISIRDIHEIIIKQILKSQHGRDPSVNARIEEAWQKRYGKRFTAMRNQGELPLPLLHGPSAIGKSRIIDAACVEVAEILGMKLVVNPKGRRSFNKDEMVVGKLNFKASGDLPFLLVGMVSINEEELEDNTKASYTTTTPNDIVYSVSENAGAGVRVLFVDEVNSGDVASAAFMALNDNDLGANIDVGDTFLIGAGNLGEDDGNLASANPVSMSTRAWNFMVKPELDHWIKNFVEPNYLSDATGDFGVSLYLKLNPDKFNEKPPKAGEIEGVSTVYGVPRTWSQLISTLESQYGDAESLSAAGVNRVKNIASGIVGPAGAGFSEFAYRLWSGVAPMVEEFMSVEGPSPAVVKKFADGQNEGRSGAERDFQNQWIYQSSLTAASQLVSELDAAGYGDGFDFSADKLAGGRKLKETKEIFRQIGARFGYTISGVKATSMINSAVADVVNQMSRMTGNVLPWLREEGGLKGVYRAEFLHGTVEKLAEGGLSKSQIDDVTKLYFGSKLSRPDMGEEKPSSSSSKPSTL